METVPQSPNDHRLTVRKVLATDLESIDEMCHSVHFDIGLHNTKVYYKQCQDWRVVVNENNEIIGVYLMNQLSNGTRYGYAVVIREEYRSQKIGSLIAPYSASELIMGSCNQDTMVRSAFHAPHWLEKRLGFFGLIQPETVGRLFPIESIPHIVSEMVTIADPSSIDRLARYDAEICRLDRRQFLIDWSAQDGDGFGRTVMAVDDRTDRCVGYGTLRPFSYYYGIQPLYADSDQIADFLLHRLTLLLPAGPVPLYLPGMADRRPIFKFCSSLGMECTGSEMRCCSPGMISYVDSLPMRKIYTVHEYFPV